MADLVFTGLPAGEPITGRFGEWYTRAVGSQYQHRGVDHGLLGEPIRSKSTRPAQVVTFTNGGDFGVGVCLEHFHQGAALYELNAHMGRRLVTEGGWVQPEQVIGYVGATGLANGPHDHWQVCDTPAFPTDIARSFDPLTFIRSEEEIDMALADDIIAVLIGNGFDAIPYQDYQQFFANCQPWKDAGSPVYPEGASNVRMFRITDRDAFEYGKKRGFSLALACELNAAALGEHASGGHK